MRANVSSGKNLSDPFARLRASGDAAEDVQRFYRANGQYETLAHVQAVAAEARSLAQQYGVDVEAANLAGLAHDLAAVVDADDMGEVAKRLGIPHREAYGAIRGLLHGPIAAQVLADRLGVEDEDVLNAVRYHSTLRAGASYLEKIVFLADKIAYDPRSHHKGEYLPRLQAAKTLEEAALVYLDFAFANAWQWGMISHPNAVDAYRELLLQRREVWPR
jgi:predicted HD superfamily hydrolase involved in NAD metabolism